MAHCTHRPRDWNWPRSRPGQGHLLVCLTFSAVEIAATQAPGLRRRHPWLALRSYTSSPTTPSSRSDGKPRPTATTGGLLLPLLTPLWISLVNTGSSPSSASCPASPLPSLCTRLTRSPASSSVPPRLPSFVRYNLIQIAEWLVTIISPVFVPGFLQTCAILETVHAAIGRMNCWTPYHLLFVFLRRKLLFCYVDETLVPFWFRIGAHIVASFFLTMGREDSLRSRCCPANLRGEPLEWCSNHQNWGLFFREPS
jgi:hypothetical protein